MFSVYGVGGRVFSGSLEQLRRQAPVGATARTRAAPAIGRDGDPGASQTGSADAASRQALAAYGQASGGAAARHPVTRVDELMSRDVLSVAHDATVLDALRRLAAHGVSQAPVLGSDGALVGLFLRADVFDPTGDARLPALAGDAAAWAARLAHPVAELMWTPVPGVAADTDVRRVAGVLLDTGLPGLPVTDDEARVIGFISRSDIVRAVATDPPLDLWG
jgi:CBS domain-containing protein